jgi:hypothetical protein
MAHVRDVNRPAAHQPRMVRMRADRMRTPGMDLNWAAAGWAGLVAGLAFLLLQTTLTTLTGGAGDATDAVRRIAGIALGETILPPTTPFTALVFVSAVAVHLPLSLIYARVLAIIVDKMSFRAAAVTGAAFGVVLYLINFYGFTFFFPWFAAARGWVTLFSHVAFGVLAASIYIELASRKRI